MEFEEFSSKMNNIVARYKHAYYSGNEELMEQIGEEQDDLLKSACHVVKVKLPHLDKNLQPIPELVSGCECPHKKDGRCSKCINFICYDTGGEPIFAFKTYDGYCFKIDQSEGDKR